MAPKLPTKVNEVFEFVTGTWFPQVSDWLCKVGLVVIAAIYMLNGRPADALPYAIAQMCVGGTMVLVAFRLGYLHWKNRKKSNSPVELEAALQVILQQLNSLTEEDEDPRVRIALHAPVENGSQLEQVTDYIGDQRKTNCMGRRFPAQSGIVGRALRQGGHFVGSRNPEKKHADLMKELVEDWGFTPEDAKKTDHETTSWFAVALRQDETSPVFGVLYCDSVLQNYFDNVQRREIVLMAAVGLVIYISKRFPAE